MKKQIIEKILIPVMQAVIFAIFGAIIGFFIGVITTQNPFLFSIGGSLLLSGWILFYSFTHAGKWYPKPLQTFNQTVNAQPTMQQTTTVILTTDSGKKGDYFFFKGFDPFKLRRIGFLLIYGKGKLSHNYLVEELGIFNRTQTKNFQNLLKNEKLAEPKTPGVAKSGLVLNQEGKIIFWELAKLHSPTEKDKEMIRPYLNRYTLHT
jgi:hypothetical protein